MRNGTYYLNRSGSKWVYYENGKKVTGTWITESGKQVVRTIIHLESFGNFGCCVISYKGKKIKVLAYSILVD